MTACCYIAGGVVAGVVIAALGSWLALELVDFEGFCQ